jgi:hypothetical protein
MLSSVFKRFIEKSPISVMARGVMERVLNSERLDDFRHEQERQRNRLETEDKVMGSIERSVYKIETDVAVLAARFDSWEKEREHVNGFSNRTMHQVGSDGVRCVRGKQGRGRPSAPWDGLSLFTRAAGRFAHRRHGGQGRASLQG